VQIEKKGLASLAGLAVVQFCSFTFAHHASRITHHHLSTLPVFSSIHQSLSTIR
jgi:hypothetical protein